MIHKALRLLVSVGKSWLPLSLVVFYGLTIGRYYRYLSLSLRNWRYLLKSLVYIPYVQYSTSFIGSCALFYFGSMMCYSNNKLLPLVFSFIISMLFIVPVKFFELELQTDLGSRGKYFHALRKLIICIVFISLLDSMLFRKMLSSFLYSYGVNNVVGIIYYAVPIAVSVISVLGFLNIADLSVFFPICFVFLVTSLICAFTFFKLLWIGHLKYLFSIDIYDFKSFIQSIMMGFFIATQTSDCFCITNATIIAHYRSVVNNTGLLHGSSYDGLTERDKLSINCFSFTFVLTAINAILAPCLIALSLFVICSGKGENILDLYLLMPKVIGYIYRLCMLIIALSLQFSIQFYLAALVKELFDHKYVYRQIALMALLVLVQLVLPSFLDCYYIGSLLMGAYSISQVLYSIYMLYVVLTRSKSGQTC